MSKFIAYLDAMPKAPLYGLNGIKSSFLQKTVGTTKRIFVLFYRDRVVLSTRSTTGKKEKEHFERPLGDIAEIHVISGPLLSNVKIRFTDGSKVKFAKVPHKGAEPLTHFSAEGIAAFDRARLTPEALTAFFFTCNLMLPLPDDLFVAPPRAKIA